MSKQQLIENKLKRLTLEDVHNRKLDVLEEIGLQKDVIVYSSQKIFSPFVPTSGGADGGGIVKKFSTGVAIFDGVMVGYKIIKSIKKIFSRRR